MPFGFHKWYNVKKFYAPGKIAINFATFIFNVFSLHFIYGIMYVQRVYTLGKIATHFEKFIIIVFSLGFINRICMSRKSMHLLVR